MVDKDRLPLYYATQTAAQRHRKVMPLEGSREPNAHPGHRSASTRSERRTTGIAVETHRQLCLYDNP